ncbi:MAG: hypothetical protein PHC91_02550 [Eubacteriales bacterium]|nr:hypothetical protein [Eubacteriales bacterium]
MNLYGGPIEQSFNEEYNRRRKNGDPEFVSRGAKSHARKQEKGEFALTEDQIRDVRDKYDLTCMSEEEEEAFLQHLIKTGILTKADGDSYIRTGGNLFEACTKQINVKIRRLYQMAIAGKESDSHVEQIRSLQKILTVLEQVKN